MASSKTKKAVVFLTNADAGQINPLLAIAHSILQNTSAETQLHVISWSGLDSELAQTVQAACPPDSRLPPREIQYHLLKSGSSQVATSDKFYNGEAFSGLYHGRSIREHIAFYRKSNDMTLLLGKEEYLGLFFEVLGLLKQIENSVGGKENVVTVVDSLLPPAMDAVLASESKAVMMWSLTLRELAIADQGIWDMLVKHPFLFSHIRFPVPWHLIPLNIFYFMCLVYSMVINTRIPAIMKARKAAHPSKPPEIPMSYIPGIPMITHSLPELEFPLKNIPKCIYPCGPVVRPGQPLDISDPELAQWLRQPGKKTLVISLGSHRMYTDENASEMAAALRVFLGRLPESQVLWKIRASNDATWQIEDLLAEEQKQGRVRILKWIKPALLAVMQEKGVIGVVNHGGANMWFESIAAGIPQVILPAWLDCYDTAIKTEYLGNGAWGNEIACPQWKAQELEAALVEVFIGPKSASYLEKAREMAQVCKAHGTGRDLAARKVLEVLENPKVDPEPSWRWSP